MDIEDFSHRILGKELLKSIVVSASLLGAEFAAYTAGVYEAETTYAWDRPLQSSRTFFRTSSGIIQGEALATLLACLTILTAMVHFSDIFRKNIQMPNLQSKNYPMNASK